MSVFFKSKLILLLFIKFDFFEMIDYLISNPNFFGIKLELYFQIYELSNF